MTTITIYFKDSERKPEVKTCSFVKVFGSFIQLVMEEDEEGNKTVLHYPSDIISHCVSKSKAQKGSRRDDFD